MKRKYFIGLFLFLFVLFSSLWVTGAKAEPLHDIDWSVLSEKQKTLFRNKIDGIIDEIMKTDGIEEYRILDVRESVKFRAFYIDDDNIPEIVYFYEANYEPRVGIMYLYGKKVYIIKADTREDILYIPRSGLIHLRFNYWKPNISEMQYDTVYKIPAGKKLFNGGFSCDYDEGDAVAVYTIDSKKVTKSKYEKQFNSVYETSNEKTALWWGSYGYIIDDEDDGSGDYDAIMACLRKTVSTPKTPSLTIKKINDGTGVKISFKKVKGAEGYYLYMTDRDNSYSKYLYNNGKYNYCLNYVAASEMKNGTYTYTIKGLLPGKYSFIVAASSEQFVDYDEIMGEYLAKHLYSYSTKKTVKIKDVKTKGISSHDSNLSKVKVGDIIKFGSYEQDGIMKNGKEPIEWIVLSKDNDKVFCLSKYALDAIPYDKDYNLVTWEQSSLRQWLNKAFYNTAFSKVEKKKIKTVKISTKDNVNYPGGNDTKDKVFLLSLEDLTNSNYGFSWDYDTEDSKRKCFSSKFARIQGSQSYYKTDLACWWLLRSPGGYLNGPAHVEEDGSVDSSGFSSWLQSSLTNNYYGINYFGVGDCVGAVRPAIYLSIS